MPRFATFQILNPSLVPDLGRGSYGRIGEIETPDPKPPVAADKVYIDLADGRVLHGQHPEAGDLFAMLGYGRLGDALTGRHTVAFGIETPGLVGQVIGLVLPDAEPILINDRTLAVAGLDRASLVAVLVEALTVVGRANARRDPDRLAADPNAGVERVFDGIQVVG